MLETINVEEKIEKEAQDLGTTPGKLKLIKMLQEVADDPVTISTEEWIDNPVKDILVAIEKYIDASEDIAIVNLIEDYEQ